MKKKLFYIFLVIITVFPAVSFAYVIEDFKEEKIQLSGISELSDKNFVGRLLSPVEKIRIKFALSLKSKIITDPKKLESLSALSSKNKVTKYVSAKSGNVFNKPYAYYRNGFYHGMYYCASKPLLFYLFVVLVLFFIIRSLIRVVF